MLETLASRLPEQTLLTGGDMAPWCQDATGSYPSAPLAVARPRTTEEVATLVRWANETETPVVPISGNTGLVGGAQANGAVLISLDRMNAIEDIHPSARTAQVQAGVILANLHDAVEEQDLIFPLNFGAKGSAMIGGCLATNAGGVNVLRYGNTRDLVLGIEAVLPNGDILNAMTALHKNNSGYDLRHLLIGAEGTLGIITRAVLKLHPRPKTQATAMVAMSSLQDALGLLRQMQDVSGGMVDAFEYMPRRHVETYLSIHPTAREPFDDPQDVNILLEISSLSPEDAILDDTGANPLETRLELQLMDFLEQGKVLDAVVARSETQRREMWRMREAASEIALTRPVVLTDIAVPLDLVPDFVDQADAALAKFDAQALPVIVSHLGDGNIHYSVWLSDPAQKDDIMALMEDVALRMGGSFSAEHGIGLSKRPAMQRHKDAGALGAMRAIKAALDPKGIMNPGKMLPSRQP